MTVTITAMKLRPLENVYGVLLTAMHHEKSADKEVPRRVIPVQRRQRVGLFRHSAMQHACPDLGSTMPPVLSMSDRQPLK